MQKRTKYIIYIIIIVVLFGTGFISGCTCSTRATKELADRNIKLQESIDNYSVTNESLKSEGIRLNNQIRGLNEKIVNFGNRLSEYSNSSREFTNDLETVSGEIKHSRQGIQNVAEGLDRIDSGLQSYIDRAENP